MNKSRRNVLTTTSTIVAAMLAGASSRAETSDWFGRKDTIEILHGAFRHLGSFNKLGRRYLDAAGGYITIDELTDRLNWRIYRDIEFSKYDNSSTSQKSKYISEIIRMDFETGNTIDVDGWILSETEVNICAILYLKSGNTKSKKN